MAKLYHPELDVTIERPESSVPVHMRSGWRPVDEQPQAEAATGMEPEKKPEKSAARTRRSSSNASEESTDGGA
jgi:hypothetical protein